jgi:hypothetical protein
MSTEFGGVLKMHFCELQIRFLPTAPNHMVWYIRYIFDCLEVSKHVFIRNMIYIRVRLICFKAISTQISINLLDSSRLHIGFLCDILTWSLF